MTDGRFDFAELFIEKAHVVMGFSMERVERKGLLITPNGLIHLPLLFKEDSQIDMAFNVIGIDDQGFLEGLFRFVVALPQKKQRAEVVENFFISRIYLNSFLKHLEGLVIKAHLLIEDSQIVISLDKHGIELDHFFVGLDGFHIISFSIKVDSLIKMG